MLKNNQVSAHELLLADDLNEERLHSFLVADECLQTFKDEVYDD